MYILNFKQNLKASSLTNAIFLCLMISIFCGCLVLIAHYQNMLNQKLEINEKLINTNKSSFDYFLANTEKLEPFKFKEIDLFEEEIPSFGLKKSWGFYDVLICKTRFKKDSVFSVALIGQNQDVKNKLALFVTDYDKPLKVSGESDFNGNLKVPNGRIEQAYIGDTKSNSVSILGSQEQSDSQIPKINKDLSLIDKDFKTVSISFFKENLVFNSFKDETIRIDVTGVSQLNNIEIKGNFILFSQRTITISNTTQLEDVLIIAPNVIVKSGFEGNIQIIAEQNVEIEEEVYLKYPSNIYVKNDTNESIVKIGKKSKIAGGIVVTGSTLKGALKRRLVIEESAIIIGDVYCYGATQLQGEIIGTIYTDKFFLKTKTADYENVIVNGTINRDSLPNNFIRLPLFNTLNKKSNYSVIKKY